MNFDLPRFLRWKRKLTFAASTNAERLEESIAEFLKEVLDVEAFFASDESTVWDFDASIDDGSNLRLQCERYYGVPVTRSMLDLPLWRLVEILNEKRGVLAAWNNRLSPQ
jgi:hypothetical protein